MLGHLIKLEMVPSGQKIAPSSSPDPPCSTWNMNRRRRERWDAAGLLGAIGKATARSIEHPCRRSVPAVSPGPHAWRARMRSQTESHSGGLGGMHAMRPSLGPQTPLTSPREVLTTHRSPSDLSMQASNASGGGRGPPRGGGLPVVGGSPSKPRLPFLSACGGRGESPGIASPPRALSSPGRGPGGALSGTHTKLPVFVWQVPVITRYPSRK
jgi:hypothetical protein